MTNMKNTGRKEEFVAEGNVFQNKCIPELFSDQARRTPNAVAAVYEDQRLTYAELDSRSNQLAHYLRDRGVKPEVVVGLCAHRSLDMLIGLLGIIKAGGAYLPLDPTYPHARLSYMITDTNVSLLVVQKAVKDRVPENGIPQVVLDDWKQIESCPKILPQSGVCPDNLLYVIYTSGSTGKPKGVMITHQSVWRLFDTTRQQINFSPKDVWTLFHSYSFDFSVWEIWGALLFGGRLVVVPFWLSRAPDEFHDLLCDEGVTILNQTPSAFAELMRAAALSQRTLLLRLVIFGGEALQFASLKPWFDQHQDTEPRLINMYGITECTVHATYRRITCGDVAGPIGSAIGKPLADLNFMVLDQNMDPTPEGQIGELYIGGAGLSRGYLHRPGLTAERFVAHPFVARERLYRTGDLVRKLGADDYEFMGRADHQVKIRGHRIELGEIQSILRERTGVKDCVVIARQDEPGQTYLVAYVVLASEGVNAAAVPDYATLKQERVSQWEQLYDQIYATQQPEAGPTFVGWNSSYTGSPIPEAEMQEWLDCTIRRIKALDPKRVFEIGCGVGLVLQRLAPICAAYDGIDLSSSAIAALQRWLAGRRGFEHVKLTHRAAADLEDIATGSFDTIVLNSVTQCFPDIDYLLLVLEKAARLTAPGGKIFVGDVRHLGLLCAFHCSVQLARNSDDITVSQLKGLVERAMAQDKELVIDPSFFFRLPEQLELITSVEVQLKRGKSDNELMRFRYDVVLYTGRQKPLSTDERMDWRSGATLTNIAEILRSQRPRSLRIEGVPNRRVADALAAIRLLESSDGETRLEHFRGQLQKARDTAEDPESFWELGERYGYEVKVLWDHICAEDSFNVDFVDVARMNVSIGSSHQKLTISKADAEVHANNPLAEGIKQKLIPLLREHLNRSLPDYMIPAHFIPLKHLPLTPEGKLDRAALPAPEGNWRGARYRYSRPSLRSKYLSPRNEIERIITGIWEEIFSIGGIGVNDDFLELGGHSLIALQLIARMEDQLNVRLTPRDIFGALTIAGLARLVGQQSTIDIA